MKGYFISIEGTDGSGKTTQIGKIVAYLENKGFSVVLTREPGGTPISEKIRNLLLDEKNNALCDRAEMLLYGAARAQHLQEKILPALAEGKIVLCDRFADSTIAYQGFGRELGMERVEAVNREATGGVMPDITIYLDLAPEKGIARKKQEDDHTLDRLEQEKMEFHQRVYEGYQALWKKYPNRIRRIDADQGTEEVFLQIKTEIDGLL